MVSTEVEKFFDDKYKAAKQMIKSCNIDFVEVGIFGSYARGTYNALSDIDFVLIVDNMPDRRQLAELRCDLEEIGCDLAVLSSETFANPNSVFSHSVKKNYRKVEL